MRKIIVIILGVFIVISCNKQPSNIDLKNIVEGYANQGKFNGNILVAQKNKVIFSGSFGYANIETKDTITSSTLFPIASLTKQFTATAIMILREKGKLSIHDNIGKYMKVPPTVKDIPIKNLMSMTSG